MKTIFNRFESQKKTIETPQEGMSLFKMGMGRIFELMKNKPGRVICGIWVFIIGIDVLIRLIGSISLAPFAVILVNFAGGLGISLFLFFYFSPHLFLEKRWFLGLFQLALILCSFLFIKYQVVSYHGLNTVSIRVFLGNEATRFFHFAVYIIFIWGFYVDGKRQELNKKMEVDHLNLKIERKSLQLSSHFVLNWLSSFFIAVKNVSPELGHQLSSFTEVLSYSYKNPNDQHSLGQEIQAVRSYLESQQFRFKNRLKLKISFKFKEIELNQLHFPKWVLMTLVENIFKHGNCLDSIHPCLIGLNMIHTPDGGKTMIFSQTNDLNRATPVSPSGFGIQTVKRILSYYFPNQFQLFTHQSETEFSLFLEVRFKPNYT